LTGPGYGVRFRRRIGRLQPLKTGNAMDYRMLGRSGLKISKLCLGTMTFGEQTDLAAATKILDSAREAGINFIDTADGYADGKSESMVGRLLKKDRDDWILATKVGASRGAPKRHRGLSRKWMMEAIDGSLRRLQTDRVDIYYMHHVDWDTPLEESVRAMGDIIADGKALYWGFSNHRAWQIAEIVRLCDALGTPRPVICQPYYNAMNRMPETDLLPACEYFGLGVVPFSPLARGVLTAKYEPGKAPGKDTRAGRGDVRMMQTEFREESLVAAKKIKAHCEKHGTTPIAFALNWVLNNALVTGVIAGPRTLAHWKGYLDALDYAFTARDEAFLEKLVAPGHPSSPGYSDPRYPPRGRPTRTPAAGR
jgi:aryl-alcohol dehydrogenase-like predicted oxidoreductase